MAKGKRYIPGIFNYCDRWCERCRFTTRCRVGRQEARLAKGGESMETALKDVAKSFEHMFRRLDREAKKEGWDLEQMAREGGEDLNRRRIEKHLDKHQLCTLAMSYMKACHDLVNSLTATYNDACDDIRSRAEFMAEELMPQAQKLPAIRAALEVLSYDHTMIAVKARRAVDGYLEVKLDEQSGQENEWSLDDANGTAAVVRRCLVRSQEALKNVYEWDKDYEDRAIELLRMAAELQTGLETILPGCKTFQWPPKE